VPLEDQIGELVKLRDEGKIGAIGISEVNVEEIEAVRKIAEVATVQNLYNLANRRSEHAVDYCTREGIGFIPWFPIAAGKLAQPGGPVDEIAKKYDATPAQVALAWLLGRPGVVAPIVGATKPHHLPDAIAALSVTLSPDQLARLEAPYRPHRILGHPDPRPR
jgi:aryl-alcohol dehydrogenase-like predicted oxidoreductase